MSVYSKIYSGNRYDVPRILLIIATGVVLAVLLGACATSRVPPTTVDKIADTWIGFNESDLYYYRLTLKTNGTGMCANTFVRNPAKLYRVTKWTLDGYAIEITLEPIDPDAEPIWMKGKTAGWHLNLEIGGKKVKWKRKLKLYREFDVLEKYERLKLYRESDVLEKYERVKARMQKAEEEPAEAEQPPWRDDEQYKIHTGNMLWTKRDSWHTGFPSQPPWCDDEQHEIQRQRLVPVPDVRFEEAFELLADASIVEIDLVTAKVLTGIPNLNPDELLLAAIAEATARADKREMEAQDPFFATHTKLFREEVREQHAAASQAEALLGKLKPYLVRAVVLWEGTGAFSGYWKESALWIHHGCLGRSPAPMERRPLVVFLEKKPTAVFNDVSMAE